MKRSIRASSGSVVPATDLQRYSGDDLIQAINDLPVGTQISGIVNAPGTFGAKRYGQDSEVIVEKKGGYSTNYGAMSRYGGRGAKVADYNQMETWWSIGGGKNHEYDVARILRGKSKYYCVLADIQASTRLRCRHRPVKASNQMFLDNNGVFDLMGGRDFDQLYKACCRKVDDEIVNQFGEGTEVLRWTPGDCSATMNSDRSYAITSQVYAQFIDETGATKDCYAELVCRYNGVSRVFDPKVTYFTDELDYE